MSQDDFVDFDSFKFNYYRFTIDCGILKVNFEKEIQELHHQPDALMEAYRVMIERVEATILSYQQKLHEVKIYKGEGALLKLQIKTEIKRQTTYVERLNLELDKIRCIARLGQLDAEDLLREAQENRDSALLIIETPELFTLIPIEQVESIIHQDDEIAKALASALETREYSSQLAQIYAVLKEQDASLVAHENNCIRSLLVKMDNHLDAKLNESVKEGREPWSLGYFGSRYRITHHNTQVAVPQGVYEIKTQLAALNSADHPPDQLLNSRP